MPIVHAYHLIPAGASKARAVARHMQSRGYARRLIAVGDSREDMGAADVVGRSGWWPTGLSATPRWPARRASRRGVRVTSEGYGAGVYEAVVTTLAERAG